MNNVANRKVICDVLVDIAKYDKDIMVLIHRRSTTK